MAAPGVRRSPLGWWRGEAATPAVGADALELALQRLALPVFALDVDGRLGVAQDGVSTLTADGDGVAYRIFA